MFRPDALRVGVGIVLIAALSTVVSGCALLSIPFSIVEGIISLVSKLPKPPPGVFF